MNAHVMLGDVLVGYLEPAGEVIAFTFDEAYLARPDRPVLGQAFEDRALSADQSITVSVATKMEGLSITKTEGRGTDRSPRAQEAAVERSGLGRRGAEAQRSKRDVVVRGWGEGVVDSALVADEGIAELACEADEGAGRAQRRGCAAGGGLLERGMLEGQGQDEGGEGVVDEVGDDELAGGEEAAELVGAHRFLPELLGFGLWAKTSRKSFSSSLGNSRSAATASSSSLRFISTR